MDYASRYSEEQMKELRRQLEEIYAQAAKEVAEKLEGFNRAFEGKSRQHLAEVELGKWTKEQYQSWLLGQVFQGNQWKQKLADITGVYTNVDKVARQLIGTGNLSIFAEAANYTAYDIAKNTGLSIAFNLYDRSTVKRLLQDNPQMLPEWEIDEQKDYVWNEKRVRNAVTQGIIQGESVPDIGKRLCGELATSNRRKMELFARTAITGAENAGRVARMEEAQDMGITVQKQWIATLDSRTRDAHQDLDGQIQDPDKPFKSALGDIRFPGDPSADPANVYNCRCTLGYYYPEYQPQKVQRRAYNDQENRESELVGNIDFMEWQALQEIKSGGHISDRSVDAIFGGKADRIVIMAKDTSVSKERAAELLESVQAYAGNLYDGIRRYQQGKFTDEDALPYIRQNAANLEDYLFKATKWGKGKTYRAIGLTETDYDAMIDLAKSGKPFDMKGISSWSSEMEVAMHHSLRGGKRVIFVCNTQKKGASIMPYSYTPYEYEVMVSSTAKYKALNCKVDSTAAWIYLEEL